MNLMMLNRRIYLRPICRLNRASYHRHGPAALYDLSFNMDGGA